MVARLFIPASVWTYIMLMVLLKPFLVVSEQAIAAPKPNKQILILSADSYGLPFPDMVIASIVDELKRNKVSINDIQVEYLDYNRNYETANRTQVINLLRQKLAQKQIALIITINRGILSYLAHEGKELLPGVPVIAFRNRSDEQSFVDEVRQSIEIITNKDVSGTLQLALSLFPATQRLVVVNAPGSSTRVTNDEIKDEIQQVAPQLDVEFTEGLAHEQMLQQIEKLPPDTIVLYGLYFRDATGRTFIPAEVAKELGRRANAPVFCIDDIQVFNGLLGGSVISGTALGKRAGELALDYLEGNVSIDQRHTTYEIEYTPLFNWQQVKRWKADISRLPERTVYYNRPVPFWEQHKKLVVSTAAVLIIQAALIISLLMQNRRRIRAEQIVEKERQRLSGIISGTNVGTWEWNIQTGEIIVNDLWLKIIGYTVEELPIVSFSTWKKFVHPEDFQASNDMLKGHFQGKLDHYQLELRMRHKDGSWKWVLARGKVFSWTEDSKPHVMMGTHQDVTDQKLAVEKIKISELRLAKLVDILQYSAETSQDLLDYSLEQIIQLTESKIGYIYHYDEDRKNFVLNSWSKNVMPECGLTNPETCYELDKTGFWGEAVRQRRTLIINDFQADNPLKKGYPEGHIQLTKFMTVPVFKENRIVKVVGLANKETDYDETDVLQVSLLIEAISKTIDRKLVEEEKQNLQLQLIQAQKMEALGALAGGIAHDFNNILGAILGYAEMVQEDCPEGSTMRSDIGSVVEACHRAKELVWQILAFSRQTLTEEKVMQPTFIIKEAMKLLRASLPTTIDIRENIDPDVGLILADSTQIHQVITNLCTNAFHAMEETGGIINISVKNQELTPADFVGEPDVKPGLFVEISVGDTGPGIAPEIMEKIYDPFFTTKDVGRGTGMGLAIIHGIVKKAGGFVSCQSSSGDGAIFNVYFPVHVSTAPSEVKSKSDKLIQTGNERILFIDDDEMLAKIGKTMIEVLGYRVSVETSSVEALQVIKNQPDRFDLIITDQTMPGMTGFDMARRILQIRPGMPIILCTGFSSLISEEKARAYGIKGFAMKPLAKKDYATLIRKVLDGEQ